MFKKVPRAFSILLLALMLTASAGCIDNDGAEKPVVPDSDGDGIPDTEDKYPLMPDFGLNLTYLDDTMINPGEYSVVLSSTVDCGVLLVDNTGVGEDTVELAVLEAPEGWGVSLDRASVALDNESIECVVVTYEVPGGASGDQRVVVQGVSKNALVPTVRNLTLICQVDGTDGEVTMKGDKVVVDYTLFDESGGQIESGTLPATAGEKYVGPGQQLGYIVGFYMGLLGMEKPPGLLGIGGGEVKRIRVPPQLAYGTDPNAHELGGMTLIFELALRTSQ